MGQRQSWKTNSLTTQEWDKFFNQRHFQLLGMLDENTMHHSFRVKEISILLGSFLGFKGENLLRIGFEFNKLKLMKELKQVIDIIVSIGCSFLEKQKDCYGFEPVRIIEKTAYLCILNGTEEAEEEFIIKLKNRFWHNFIKKFPHHRNLLFEELSNIDPDTLRFKHSFLFEDQLLSQLNKSNILKFVEKLRKNLP